MATKTQYLRLQVFSQMDLSAEESLGLRNRAIKENLPPKQWSEIAQKIGFKSANALRLLSFISDYENGFFRPDRINVYEPIRELFNPNDLSRPISWLSQLGGAVAFKKIKPFKYEGSVENRRLDVHWEEKEKKDVLIPPRVPDPVFLTEWCLWVDTRILKLQSADYLKRFFIDLFLISKGDYGFLTMEEDYQLKNFLITEEKGGTSEEFVGDNLEKCLPGVYWTNIFGKLYVDWFAKKKFESLPCYYREELRDGSYFVQVAEDPYYYKNPETRFVDREIVNYLGKEAFFDIHTPDRKCKTPDFSKLRNS